MAHSWPMRFASEPWNSAGLAENGSSQGVTTYVHKERDREEVSGTYCGVRG